MEDVVGLIVGKLNLLNVVRDEVSFFKIEAIFFQPHL